MNTPSSIKEEAGKTIYQMSGEELATFVVGPRSVLLVVAEDKMRRQGVDPNTIRVDLVRGRYVRGGLGGAANQQATSTARCNAGAGSLLAVVAQSEPLSEGFSMRLTASERVYLNKEAKMTGLDVSQIIRLAIQGMRHNKTVQIVVRRLGWDESVSAVIRNAQKAAYIALKAAAATRGILAHAEDPLVRKEGRELYQVVVTSVLETKRVSQLLGCLTRQQVEGIVKCREEILDVLEGKKEQTISIQNLLPLAESLKALGFSRDDA